MTVKWLLYWQPNPGATINSQILTEVSQCVETVNATKGGRWKSSLTYYKPQPKDQTIPLTDCQRDLVGIALQEQPNKYYFIIRSQQIVLEADSTLQTIMEKLQSYRSRALVSFEGFQYHLGDFQLKVGKVVTAQADNLRGIVMEVEYLPISSIEKSRQIMEEFYDMWQETVSKKSLPGHFMHIEGNFADYGLADNYTSQHTVVQYSAVMNQLLANVRT